MIDFRNLSFSGTQAGMTEPQLLGTMGFLVLSGCVQVHHGDCIGADEQFHYLCQALRPSRGLAIIVHPPINDSKRAWVKGATLTVAAKPYLERNRDVVNAGDVLLATPKEDAETVRSGTWTTIRYARGLNCPICIIWPNGSRQYENWPEVSA